ncbi:MAG: hypothetical protein Q8P76_01880 [bacterium]|nr:hypothetical protein [bacterium]
MVWLKRILLVLAIICLGTIIDYIAHQIDPRFSVPSSYFPHKILYGTLWAFAGYLVFKKYLNTPFKLALVLSATPAIILQIIYIINGHLFLWVSFLFMVLHFLMFLLPGFYICRKYQSVFN